MASTKNRVGAGAGQSAQEACTALAELAPGSRGRLCTHPPVRAIAERLEEFGFVPGTVLEVIRAAPFGDPIEIEIRGYRICLRRAELAGLCVVTADTAA